MDPELEWITRTAGQPAVRGQRIQLLWSGYGEIYRITLGDRTAIVKSVRPPTDGRGVGHARKVRSYDVELAWYQRYTSSARVPGLIAGEKREGQWLFLLEDLDAAGFPGRRRGIDPCLRWLATFHRAFLGVVPDGLWETGTYWHLATRQEELAAIDDDALRAAAPILDARLRQARYQTIVHGDAKLANFCFGDMGAAAVDFQYVGGGCGMRDVAYLLCGTPDEERHLDDYFRYLNNAEVEREWRALYPIAVADFYRFLAGWSKEHWRSDHAAQAVVREVLRTL